MDGPAAAIAPQRDTLVQYRFRLHWCFIKKKPSQSQTKKFQTIRMFVFMTVTDAPKRLGLFAVLLVILTAMAVIMFSNGKNAFDNARTSIHYHVH